MSLLPSPGEHKWFEKIVNWFLVSHNPDGTIKSELLDAVVPGDIVTQQDLDLAVGTKADQAGLSALTATVATKAFQVDLDDTNDVVATKADATATTTALATKASQTALDATNATVSGNSSSIATHTTQISRVDPGAAAIAVVPDGSALTYEGGSPKVRKLGYWDATWSGATSYPDGTLWAGMVDSSAAWATAHAKAKLLCVPLTGQGTFRVDSLVTIDTTAQLGRATFVTNDTTIAPLVRVGSITTFIEGIRVTTPKISQSGKAALGTDVWGSDTGLQLANLINSEVVVSKVENFGVGLHVYAEGTGFSYNELRLLDLANNKINLLVDAGTTGYVNECVWYGGRFRYYSGGANGLAGTRHIKFLANGVHAINNHKFIKPCIEGDKPEYHIDATELMSTNFDNARYESSTPKAFLTNCNGVVFNEGYNCGALVISGSGNLNIKHITRDWTKIISGGGASGVLRLANTSSNANPAIAIATTLADSSTDFSTAYTVAISANTTKYKATADATSVERLTITHATGALKWQDVDLSRPAANVLALGADDSFKTGRNVTASRPSASTAGAGSMFYDTTLSKPIWSDGTVWKDATGTAV